MFCWQVADAVLIAVAKAPNLRHLSISYCQAVTDAGLSAVASSRPELLTLRIDECVKVSDVGITAVAGGCKSLRELSVRRCSKLTDASLALVAQRGCLQRLCINGVPGAGTATMRALATNCKDCLEELDVSFCRGVSEVSLGLVADKCSRLHTLQLFGCSQITKLFLHGHSNDNLVNVVGLGTLVEAA